MLKRTFIMLLSLAVLVILPATGVMFKGGEISRYLSFPPVTGYVKPPPFSLGAFIFLAGVIILVLFHPVRHIICGPSSAKAKAD